MVRLSLNQSVCPSCLPSFIVFFFPGLLLSPLFFLVFLCMPPMRTHTHTDTHRFVLTHSLSRASNPDIFLTRMITQPYSPNQQKNPHMYTHRHTSPNSSSLSKTHSQILFHTSLLINSSGLELPAFPLSLDCHSSFIHPSPFLSVYLYLLPSFIFRLSVVLDSVDLSQMVDCSYDYNRSFSFSLALALVLALALSLCTSPRHTHTLCFSIIILC